MTTLSTVQSAGGTIQRQLVRPATLLGILLDLSISNELAAADAATAVYAVLAVTVGNAAPSIAAGSQNDQTLAMISIRAFTDVASAVFDQKVVYVPVTLRFPQRQILTLYLTYTSSACFGISTLYFK